MRLQFSAAKRVPGQGIPSSLLFQAPLICNTPLTWDGETAPLPMKTILDAPGFQYHWTPQGSCPESAGGGRWVAGGSPRRLSPGHPDLGNSPRVCTHWAPHGESVSLGSQSEFLPRKVQMNTINQLVLFSKLTSVHGVGTSPELLPHAESPTQCSFGPLAARKALTQLGKLLTAGVFRGDVAS